MSPNKKRTAQSSEDPKMDRISDLPTELLCHILSLLPIRQAFTTTVLSKQWTQLSYSPTNLNFDYETFAKDDEPFHRFCCCVNTVMLSRHSSSQPIKTFSLNCGGSSFSDSDQHLFDAWVEAAKRRCVEEFHLSMNNYTLTAIIFSSETLVVMKLEELKIAGDNLHVDLPSLKILHLKFVGFENRSVLKKLLNACPVLEDLNTFLIVYLKDDKNNTTEGFKPLSKCVRADIDSSHVPFDVFYNVEFLCIINTERDQMYRFENIFKGTPVFQNLIQLRLCLMFTDFYLGWNGIVKLLRHCPKLQSFKIAKWLTNLSKDWQCPILDLECVLSHLRSCIIYNFEGSEEDLQFATYILRNARLLRVMSVYLPNNSSKHLIVEELSSCPRISTGCKLYVDRSRC